MGEHMLIDFHLHTFPDKIAGGAVGKLYDICGIPPATNGTVAATLKKMDETGTNIAVSLNIATNPGQETTINRTAAGLWEQTNGRIIGFGSVHPDSPDALEQLDHIAALGIKGIKFHPDYQGFFIDEERMFPLYERCGELGLLVVFHAGWDPVSPDVIHAQPRAGQAIARRFPQTKFVFAHMGGMRCWDAVENYLVGESNAYFDTSMAASECSKEQALRILNAHMEENILFGSDCPWEEPAASKAFIEDMPLSEEYKQKIFSGNAKRLLGME